MDLETRQERLEPGEAELLAEKREYERNLKNLDAHSPARKQFWLEHYARESVINTAPHPKRAAWFQKELALREWNVHGLQAQGGPDWKTSRKVLDGLAVSRETRSAISSPNCITRSATLWR